MRDSSRLKAATEAFQVGAAGNEDLVRAEFGQYEAKIAAIIVELSQMVERVEVLRKEVEEVPVVKVPQQEKADEVHREISKAQAAVSSGLKQAQKSLGFNTLTPLRMIRDRCGQIADQQEWEPGKYGY